MLNLLPEQYNQFFLTDFCFHHYYLLSNSSGVTPVSMFIGSSGLKSVQPLFAVTLTLLPLCLRHSVLLLSPLWCLFLTPIYERLSLVHQSLHEAGSEVSYWLFSSYAKLFLWVTAHSCVSPTNSLLKPSHIVLTETSSLNSWSSSSSSVFQNQVIFCPKPVFSFLYFLFSIKAYSPSYPS